ncbi:substrate-binding domain-containing protein [Bacillus sp. NPDC077027]|uniref:substrate-binding domain-containing protein n=1 Tax=Bacillus sp. NPDC077027 TaxID=3390548 RepID=UPI003D019E8B
MRQETSYTIEELADLLKVSKLTVYDLIKKGTLTAYRVGRQMRVDEADLFTYKMKMKTTPPVKQEVTQSSAPHSLVISGQDVSMDMLSRLLEDELTVPPLRKYSGSLTNLVELFHGKGDIVGLHLYDHDTKTYNVPYVKRVLTGQRYCLIHVVRRTAGLYVQKGNPKNIMGWKDMLRPEIRIVNREIGAGARVLLDEKLKEIGATFTAINGYDQVATSHHAIAAAVAANQADVGVGTLQAAKLADIEFIPMIEEQYDVLILKKDHTLNLIKTVKRILKSEFFIQMFQAMEGYDISQSGTVIEESE